jgi:hypothetical protein
MPQVFGLLGIRFLIIGNKLSKSEIKNQKIEKNVSKGF